jgi:hypothetical protein
LHATHDVKKSIVVCLGLGRVQDVSEGGLVINYIFKISWVDYVATVIMLGFVAKEGLEAISEM